MRDVPLSLPAGSRPIQTRSQSPDPSSTVSPRLSSSPSSRATAASSPSPTRVAPTHDGTEQSTQQQSHTAQAGVCASKLAASSRPGTAPKAQDSSSRPLSRGGAGVALLRQAGFAAASAHPRASKAGNAAPSKRQQSPGRVQKGKCLHTMR